MRKTTAVAPGQLDFMSMFEDIFAIANEAVAELDEAAQRRAKLLAEIERWKNWKPSAPCNLFTLFKFGNSIGMMLTGSAIAIYRAMQEGESLKKHEPLLPVELPPESTPDVEAHALTTTETQPEPIESSVEPALILTAPNSSSELIKPARKKKAPKVRTKFPRPKLSGEAIWLDDDELLGTEPYIGCYAVLDGQVGLSFKGLAHSLPMRIDNQEYIAQPGTFQPLVMEGWMRDRLISLIAVWAACTLLVESESDPSIDDETIEDRREALNLAYDDFFVNHGYIHQNKGLTQFNGLTDTRLYMLMALEAEDGDNGYVKASIFRDRQQYPSKPPTTQFYFDEDPIERCKQAFIKCLDECGLRFDLELTATLAGLEPEEVEEYLLDLGLIYRDPIVEV